MRPGYFYALVGVLVGLVVAMGFSAQPDVSPCKVSLVMPGRVVCLNDSLQTGDHTQPIMIDVKNPPVTPSAAKWSLSWAPSGKIRIWQTANKTGSIFNGRKYPWPPPSVPCWVQGVATGESTITLKIFPDGTDPIKKEQVTVVVVKANIDAQKVAHNKAAGNLEHDKSETPGAFVPLNDDDDDYDVQNTPDKDQSGPIAGESDLLPIMLRAIYPPRVGGTYRLGIPANVRVWSEPNRSGQVTATTPFDATVDTTVYVEGVAETSGLILLHWTGGEGLTSVSDQLKVSVFKWAGPLNVPGYSKYNYTARGGLEGSGWTSPGGGAIQSGEGTSSATILWGEGPFVGKAAYRVTPDYIWDLEVNVVAMKIKSAQNNAIYHSSPGQPNGAGSTLITSNSSGPAMTATLAFEKIEGPLVNGAHRGVKFMEIGHVHQAEFTSKHGIRTGAVPALRRRSSLQDGLVHWDSGVGTTVPWTFMDSGHYLAPMTDDTIRDAVISTSDTPVLLGKDYRVYDRDGMNALNIVMTHYTYVAVKTRVPDVNGSAAVISKRAKLDWTFNGSGVMNETGVWVLTGTGSTGDMGYTEIQSGEQVASAAANINEAFTTEAWITEDEVSGARAQVDGAATGSVGQASVVQSVSHDASGAGGR